MYRIGIIGTAGRDNNVGTKMMDYMQSIIRKITAEMQDIHGEVMFVSGGAAVADHMAVWAGRVLNKPVRLHTPCGWDFVNRQFYSDGTKDFITNPGGTLNYYHRKWCKSLGKNENASLEKIHEGLVAGRIQMIPVPAETKGSRLHARNIEIGRDCDLLVAFTFGKGDRPQDGGTGHCWMNCPLPLDQKVHYSLLDIGKIPENESAEEVPQHMKAPSFRGELSFLSNMHPCEVPFEGLVYKSVENAYQAAKFSKPERKRIMDMNPYDAKKFAKHIHLSKEDKLRIMEDLLRAKFSASLNPDLAKKLRLTGDIHLCEYNTWGDTFWGVCDGVGENQLGQLLMKLRAELQ